MDIYALFQAFAALIFVLGVILTLAYVMRRWGAIKINGMNKHTALQIIYWQNIDARRKLTVLEWGEREYLLLLGQNNDLLIDQREKSVSTFSAKTDIERKE